MMGKTVASVMVPSKRPGKPGAAAGKRASAAQTTGTGG
jgi:hypothetical protein